MEKIEILKKTPLFEGITLSFFPKIAPFFEFVEYDEESTIFEEGDKWDYLYIIAEGTVPVLLNIEGIGVEEVAILKQYEFFGEMAILDKGVRSATTVAKKGTKLLRVKGEKFYEFISESTPESVIILENLIKKISVRIRNTSNKLNSFYLMDMSI